MAVAVAKFKLNQLDLQSVISVTCKLGARWLHYAPVLCLFFAVLVVLSLVWLSFTMASFGSSISGLI